jgi:hypothetical protein
LITIEAPAMTDASGAFSAGITLSLEEEEGKTVRTVTADEAWLDAPERAYPVTIDPTYQLTGDHLFHGVVQAFDGYASGPDTEHKNLSRLYAGFEDGSLVSMLGIVYGECWSYLQIKDITPYIQDLPEVAILTAKLRAWKYSGAAEPARRVSAKMIAGSWGGAEYTWTNRPTELTDLANAQDVSGDKKWVEWDITDAFKEWKRDPSTNLGLMPVPKLKSNPPSASPARATSKAAKRYTLSFHGRCPTRWTRICRWTGRT